MTNNDGGTAFGLWQDATSRYMYFDVMNEILPCLPEHALIGKIADYGGGNGVLKTFLPDAITIDCDTEKRPDIVDDILTHEGDYDTIFLRYVLHYLNDYEVLGLFRHIATFHKGCIVVIQFINHDLHVKYANSVGETKYFRTREQLQALLPLQHNLRITRTYRVTKEFYRNRLGNENATEHYEAIDLYLIML